MYETLKSIFVFPICREVLVERRDKRLLEAFLNGKNNISDELVFRSPDGTILDPDNLYHRVFLPVLAKAGIRRIRLHDLRHTFGSLLLQSGASIVYVKEQMGHSSIQVTVDIYGHLIPGANVCFVDRLDGGPAEGAETTPQQSARPAQQDEMKIPSDLLQVVEGIGGGGRTRTYDLRIMSSPPGGDSKEFQPNSSANSGKDLQNPQPPRNQEQAAPPTESAQTQQCDGRQDDGGYPHEP